MKCKEFQKQFDYFLDTNQPRGFSGRMANHLRTCPQCTQYVHDMEEVDALLRAAPDVEFPPGLEAKLLAIPSYAAEHAALPTWTGVLGRAAIYTAPVVLLALVWPGLALDWRVIIHTAVTSLALVALALQWTRRLSYPDVPGHQALDAIGR